MLLMESDPQGITRDWSGVREEHLLSVVGIDPHTIERDLKTSFEKTLPSSTECRKRPTWPCQSSRLRISF